MCKIGKLEITWKRYTYLQESFSCAISKSARFPSDFCFEITSKLTYAKSSHLLPVSLQSHLNLFYLNNVSPRSYVSSCTKAAKVGKDSRMSGHVRGGLWVWGEN